jgi:hypothetical protein
MGTVLRRLTGYTHACDLIELGHIAGFRGNTIQVSTPFTICDQELTLFITAIEQDITERENR